MTFLEKLVKELNISVKVNIFFANLYKGAYDSTQTHLCIIIIQICQNFINYS